MASNLTMSVVLVEIMHQRIPPDLRAADQRTVRQGIGFDGPRKIVPVLRSAATVILVNCQAR